MAHRGNSLFSAHASLCTVKVKRGENHQRRFLSTGDLKWIPASALWGQVVLSVFGERWALSPDFPLHQKQFLYVVLYAVGSGCCTAELKPAALGTKRREMIKGEGLRQLRNVSAVIPNTLSGHVLLTQHNGCHRWNWTTQTAALTSQESYSSSSINPSVTVYPV